jgi:hypothetical protein
VFFGDTPFKIASVIAGEPQDAAYIGVIDLFCIGKVGDRGEPAR